MMIPLTFQYTACGAYTLPMNEIFFVILELAQRANFLQAHFKSKPHTPLVCDYAQMNLFELGSDFTGQF